MSTVFTEGLRPGEVLLTEANGQISREVGVIASGSGILAPGTVLGKNSTSGKYAPSPATGTDGTQTAVAVALYGCDATSADQKITIIARDAEVKADYLVHHTSVNDAPKRAAKATQLAAVGIIVRA
ncbi:MAG: hypothetical protein B7Y80_21125 [Hyphomicrobium sp. 32-62-53]|nr:MAG: hypothetical protein B7Z29_20990 [Hyphomicrobium sp. 12-62-95]OYX97069.1 MAG: hypothetical protein B7Y80_21125 [Hyphomicrobium sp. 32-62-53]